MSESGRDPYQSGLDRTSVRYRRGEAVWYWGSVHVERDIDAEGIQQPQAQGRAMTAAPDPADREVITSLPATLNDISVSYIASLAEIGIELVAYGSVTIDPEPRYARIGFVRLTDDGGAVAAHCVDATALQIAELCRQAEIALLDGPIGPLWRRLRSGWECSILEPVADARPIPQCRRVPRPSTVL